MSDDLEFLRAKLTTLAGELLVRRGAWGVSVGDLRYSAENIGLLTGDESGSMALTQRHLPLRAGLRSA